MKDVASIADGRAHKLLGYGFVVGMQGTGDGKKAPFTVQSLANMLEQFGISIEASQLDVDNVAAVMVTGDLSSGAAAAVRMDVTVSSLGDAASLQGGTLLLTPLRGADGQIYAIAQGPVSVGGYQAGGRGASVTRNHTAVGRMPNGASVVLPAPASAVLSAGRLSLQLHQPDFTTAGRLADSISSGLGRICAHAVNSAMIQVAIPPDTPDLTTLIRHIEALPVQPDMPVQVVSLGEGCTCEPPSGCSASLSPWESSASSSASPTFSPDRSRPGWQSSGRGRASADLRGDGVTGDAVWDPIADRDRPWRDGGVMRRTSTVIVGGHKDRAMQRPPGSRSPMTSTRRSEAPEICCRRVALCAVAPAGPGIVYMIVDAVVRLSRGCDVEPV
ncbi:MAG: flagellar basal body P-ring protein FlgI [candidate division WS1 bacterium]|nr:flagellar basal body P-ring protein FlgI [candidate division WS1 bacterium]